MCLSSHHTYSDRFFVSGHDLWYLHECFRIQLLVSHAHELTIFAGFIEFVTVNLLLGAFHPVQALAMALMINARHLFYGISMLEKY